MRLLRAKHAQRGQKGKQLTTIRLLNEAINQAAGTHYYAVYTKIKSQKL